MSQTRSYDAGVDVDPHERGDRRREQERRAPGLRAQEGAQRRLEAPGPRRATGVRRCLRLGHPLQASVTERLEEVQRRGEEDRAGDGMREVEQAIVVPGRAADEHVPEHQLEHARRARVGSAMEIRARFAGCGVADRAMLCRIGSSLTSGPSAHPIAIEVVHVPLHEHVASACRTATSSSPTIVAATASAPAGVLGVPSTKPMRSRCSRRAAERRATSQASEPNAPRTTAARGCRAARRRGRAPAGRRTPRARVAAVVSGVDRQDEEDRVPRRGLRHRLRRRPPRTGRY